MSQGWLHLLVSRVMDLGLNIQRLGHVIRNLPCIYATIAMSRTSEVTLHGVTVARERYASTESCSAVNVASPKTIGLQCLKPCGRDTAN
jgi:hypothetical protein